MAFTTSRCSSSMLRNSGVNGNSRPSPFCSRPDRASASRWRNRVAPLARQQFALGTPAVMYATEATGFRQSGKWFITARYCPGSKNPFRAFST